MDRIKIAVASCIPKKFITFSKSTTSNDNIPTDNSVLKRLKKYLFSDKTDEEEDIEYIDAESDDSDGFVVVTQSEIYCFKRHNADGDLSGNKSLKSIQDQDEFEYCNQCHVLAEIIHKPKKDEQ